jgi:hypothetical protein
VIIKITFWHDIKAVFSAVYLPSPQMIFLSRHIASAMKSSKMWHRNSYVHPLDASRGPAQRKVVVLGGRLHEVRYVLKHKTCNSFLAGAATGGEMSIIMLLDS